MPSYNKNSVFTVSNAGTIPNRVDDLIFFEDVNRQQKLVWDEFERIMATGDYDAAHAYIMNYADVHGYFGDLYNMMVNRIKAAQNLLILNRTNIQNGTGAFSSFKKPEIFVYQQTPTSPKTIAKDQVWIGPKGYFDEVSVKDSLNVLNPGYPGGLAPGSCSSDTIYGLTLCHLDSGYIKISGTGKFMQDNAYIILARVETNIVSNEDVWSYWNYYVSGSVSNYISGRFVFEWTDATSNKRVINIPTSRTANMHANLLDLPPKNRASVVNLYMKTTNGEVYDDLIVGFMICKTKDTSPNQKFEKYRG